MKTFYARFRAYGNVPAQLYGIEIKKEFELFGEKFAVHRKLSRPFKDVVISKDTWDVSHIETGFTLIDTYPKTIKQAILDAENMVTKHGIEKIKIAIAEAKHRNNQDL